MNWAARLSSSCIKLLFCDSESEVSRSSNGFIWAMRHAHMMLVHPRFNTNSTQIPSSVLHSFLKQTTHSSFEHEVWVQGFLKGLLQIKTKVSSFMSMKMQPMAKASSYLIPCLNFNTPKYKVQYLAKIS